MNLISNLPLYLLSLPIALLALSVHESAHGYVAYKLGDPTAYSLGRLTLNPLKHFDPIGLICMVIFHIGWAKPVPINTRYFKNPKRGLALSAALLHTGGDAGVLLLPFCRRKTGVLGESAVKGRHIVETAVAGDVNDITVGGVQ